MAVREGIAGTVGYVAKRGQAYARRANASSSSREARRQLVGVGVDLIQREISR
jgi:hypothetical protein